MRSCFRDPWVCVVLILSFSAIPIPTHKHAQHAAWLMRTPLKDTITMNSAMSACEYSRQWQLAIMLFDDMLGRGLLPDVASCNIVMSACEKANHWEHSLVVLRDSVLSRGYLDEVADSSGLWVVLCHYGKRADYHHDMSCLHGQRVRLWHMTSAPTHAPAPKATTRTNQLMTSNHIANALVNGRPTTEDHTLARSGPPPSANEQSPPDRRRDKWTSAGNIRGQATPCARQAIVILSQGSGGTR